MTQAPPEGVLVVDKPSGPTSHDIVAAARRLLHQPRIGHTGTLDPLATGVLPLACGRATRLVRFLTASHKTYRAVVHFGLETDSYDITGETVSRSGRVPEPDAVLAGLAAMRGEQLQVPPAHSAKKVGGRRAYERARNQETVTLQPVPVRVLDVQMVATDGPLTTIELTVSAGFYVRSFAHDLGQRLGTGACLEALRRTAAGDFTLDGAVTLDALAAAPDQARAQLVPLRRLAAWLPSVVVGEPGLARLRHGRDVRREDLEQGPLTAAAPWTRLLTADGELLALAEPGDVEGTLHPSLVLI